MRVLVAPRPFQSLVFSFSFLPLDGCIVVSPDGCKVHFLDDWGQQTPSRIFIRHLDILFCECQNLLPTFLLDHLCFLYLLVQFFMYLDISSCWICVLQISFSTLWLLFHFIKDIFWWTEVLNFNSTIFQLFIYGECLFYLVYEIIAYVIFSKPFYFIFHI